MTVRRDRAAIVLAVCAAYIFLTMGFRQSFGLYMAPFTELKITDIGAFSLAIGMQNIFWGIASPFFGAFADRRGPAGAAAVGGALYAAGLFVMAAAVGGGGVLLGQMLVGAGIGGAGFSVMLGAAGKVAPPAHRSMILAAVAAAGSLGQFALVPPVQGLLEHFGARESLYAMAACALLMVALAPLLRLPSGARTAGQSGGGALMCALRVRGYVLLTLGFFVCGFQVVFVATHLPKYVADNGISDSVAAWALAMVGLCNVFGTLACGWLGDRYPKKNVLTAFYLARSAIIALFWLAPISSFSVVAFGAALGFLWLGTVPLTSGLISVFFGVRHLSMLYGVTFLMHQVGSFLGAWMGGKIYAAYSNYDLMWALMILSGVVAALLHSPISERADDKFTRAFA